MKISNLYRAAVFAATLLAPGAASAIPFNFSYTLGNGSLLTGMMEGDLQPDGDTVFVTAVTMAALDGILGPATPFLTDGEGGVGTPTASISGSLMDFCAATAPCGGEGLLFGQ